MRRKFINQVTRPAAITVCCLLVLASTFQTVQADATSIPSLVISQLKMTSSSGQFITLYNTTNSTLDMSKYQLEYFNNYDLSKASSSKLIILTGSLAPHSYLMVNDSSLLLCYQLTINSISLGLSSTAGFVGVLALNQSAPGSLVGAQMQDYVSWSKTAASGAVTLPATTNAFLQRQPLDNQGNPAISSAGAGSWQTVQPDSVNPCKLLTTNPNGTTGVNLQTGINQLLPGSEPPATIVAADAAGTNTVVSGVLPTADIGLMAPQITELLPNPIGTGNDGTDEFIEIYNPNPTAFDLTGFSLEAGTTVLHQYLFPAGASLPAQSFAAFYAKDTGLSLSNTSGQTKLLDPFGNSLSASDTYSTAADGQAWARADGRWFWTTSPTPGAANVINKPPVKASAKAAAAKTPKSKTSAKSKAAKPKAASKLVTAAGFTDQTPVTPIHNWLLALAASLALLYGAYEYRADLANRIRQLRRNDKHRRADRT